MRVSRAQAEANHEAIIDTASQLFREHGFDGISLKDLMSGAGLTQGGFYKRFSSKQDLMARSSARAMEGATQLWCDAAETQPEQALNAVLDFYLSPDHRAARAQGCPMVALGSDAARQGPEVKAAFEAGLKTHLDIMSKLVPSSGKADDAGTPMAITALMIGAVMLSRMVNDTDLGNEILSAARQGALRIASAGEGTGADAPACTANSPTA